MNRATLTVAKREAKRLIEAIREVEVESAREDSDYILIGTRKTGALRRASMDLTRALADLRRSA